MFLCEVLGGRLTAVLDLLLLLDGGVSVQVGRFLPIARSVRCWGILRMLPDLINWYVYLKVVWLVLITTP